MGTVIEFPYGEISNPLAYDQDPVMDHVHEIIHKLVDHMAQLGYDVNNEQTIHDLGVMSNFMVGILMREFGRDHFLHETLDELWIELNKLREMANDIN